MAGKRFYENAAEGRRRSAPAALRNREPIAEVLTDWLPDDGLVLEIASGTGEHVVHFGARFPALIWQPSDIHPEALSSIEEARLEAALPNVRPALVIDASAPHWPIDRAAVVLSINMVHISPWASALGLIEGAGRLLSPGGPLILYGPWLKTDLPTAPSNLDFDSDLKRRDPEWGLRQVEDFQVAAAERGLALIETRAMPANNLTLLLRRR
jgi:SAM-dependent methyltransferase